jgi:pSer/pThr/pTyr-binding forkhead associated (FHA) protein
MGARFPLVEAVTIGRSSQVEIFVADAGVSRRHAKVMPAPDGGHLLVDLGSANGTLVDDERITEIVLQLGMQFTIGGTVFAYEEATPTQPVAPDRGVYAVSGGLGRPVERTVVSLESPPEHGPNGRVVARPATAAKKPSETPIEAGWRRIEATAPSGEPYPGDLVNDVILYRNLRLRRRRGDDLPPPIRARYQALESRLLQPPTPRDDPTADREFARFACCFPAHLRFSRGEESGFAVEVHDFGVGGAKVACAGLLLDLDELTWLAIDLVSASGSRTIVFTSRVVWLRDGELGLVFSGAPGWARHSGRAEHEETMLVDRDAVPASARRPVRLHMAATGDGD